MRLTHEDLVSLMSNEVSKLKCAVEGLYTIGPPERVRDCIDRLTELFNEYKRLEKLSRGG